MSGGTEDATFAQLLARAGLEAEEAKPVEDVLWPRAAWRPVIAADAVPSVAVHRDRADLVAELNAQWHRLATERGVIGTDGAFLVNVAGSRQGPAAHGWTRVRLAARWDLAGVLGERPGQPEFVTLSADRNTLLGVTTEEYEVWLIAVEGLGRRRLAAAEAAARETPQERDAAWASLFNSPGPGLVKRLAQLWALGLSRSPAASEDVLQGLLGHSHHLPWRRDLPPSVVDAGLAHPEWRVRGLFAEARPTVTPEQWTRLVLIEQDPRRRWILATLAVDRREELTGPAYEQLAADPAARTRAEAARLKGMPAHLLTALATDPEPTVRASACRPAWPYLNDPARQSLLDDTNPEARTAALQRHHEEHPLTRAAFESEELPALGAEALRRCRLDRDLAETLARQGHADERRMLADNPHLDPDLTALLARDPDDDVRYRVSLRPDLTEAQRADIRIEIDPRARFHALDWVVALHHDPEAMRRLAASSHPLVRRSVARAERLPEDVVALLARDEDRVVQLFLAESCDDAPADMLLRVWRWWTGSLSHPDRPRGHPNFPRHGLLRYVDDPDPRTRRLALDDPASSTELVERFSRDKAEEVRLRAAEDPRLTSAAAVWLLDDPCETVRRAAALHPRLPARVLCRLLRDGETAETAAANPSLPAEVMGQMVRCLAG
ncbi:PE-PGRS family protein [Streptomyces luteoverticillatus]|uniref:PE-PGRS family protein n=1 Tax=Streptomyces luteoverticillatus TaxID=66425 RepID=A0A3S9PRZ3_STRLT|nr:PE-PGRS family protein [Streptomyces luteoverticillatus]AZQ75068.1 PE-PGRS family protein [Streptomyces luteoverticillatus]